jgi:phosphatidyl-myo-inositol alpha-mannosyltransferase
MNKMKIGLVSPYNMFRSGGVQEHVLGVRDELKRHGHHVTIITPQPRDYAGEAPAGMIFLGGSTDFYSPFHTQGQISVTASPERIEEVLEREQFDLLHFHEPWVPIVARQILSRSNTVNVATFHARLPDNVMSRTIERVIVPYTKSIFKYLDKLTSVSEDGAEWVSQLTDEPITIIPNGIDMRKYKPGKHKPLPHPTIFYVGRLEKRKGVQYLLEAFQALQKRMPEVRLLIAGRGPDLEKLQDFLDEEGIENVEFLGPIDDAEKIRYLQSADVACFPSPYGESFGVVLLEALACGIPTVAGSNPGYRSVLLERGSLGLVNPKDTKDFASRLELFLTDQDLRTSWKKWAKEYVRQYDYRHVADCYEKIYQRAVKEHK